nr:hypothetical protein [Komagataeibacter medellinensis]
MHQPFRAVDDGAGHRLDPVFRVALQYFGAGLLAGTRTQSGVGVEMEDAFGQGFRCGRRKQEAALPSRMMSGMAPTGVAMTGSPACMASCTAMHSPSKCEGCTYTCSLRQKASGSG